MNQSTPQIQTPSIQKFPTVRKDCRQRQGGGLLTLIHKSINFSRKCESPETLVEHYKRLHTSSKLLHKRLPFFPLPFDDDDGYLILVELYAHHSA